MVRFNENNEVIREEEYTAILAGIQLREDISYSMEELAGLAEADGVTVAGQMIQSLERPNTATLIGKGKVEELAELCRNMEADMVIFNDELSGVQLRIWKKRWRCASSTGRSLYWTFLQIVPFPGKESCRWNLLSFSIVCRG